MPWRHNDLSAATGAPAASGIPDGYMFDAQGTQHVVHRGDDGHVHELWWDGGGWHHNDLSAATGAPDASGDPAGYMFDAQGTQHVVYRAGDAHIHELWWDGGGWHHNDLSAAAGAPAAAGDPDGYMFDAQGTQHVVYRGDDGHVHELWWDGGGWHHNDLTAAAGGPGAVGDPAGYMFDAQGTQHVVHRAGDGHIHELWWDGGGWHHNDLTAAAGAPDAVGDPAGYMFDAQGTQHVVYRAGDAHIHELWWDGAGWHHNDLSAATGAPDAVGDPAGYMFDAQGTQHVVYRAGDGHIHELWWDGGGWHRNDLSAEAGAPGASSDPAGYMFDAQGTQHVVYRGGAAVQELWWAPGGPVFVRREAWGLEAAGPFDPITLAYAKGVQAMQARPASDPTSWTYQAGIHGAYVAPPAGAVWNDCQHQSWFFLSWHRMYLYFFERIVRKAVADAGGPADFALPYWNYDRPFPGNTLPPAFRTATLPDGSANPLFLAAPRRSGALMAGGQVPATATTSAAAMASVDFSLPGGAPSFGGGRVGPAHFGGATGLLESTPHNVMHPTIGGPQSGQCQGGLMTDPNCAALDPIFWLHHANIDRLWNRWLALGGGRANPTQSSWLASAFTFADETGARVTMTGADVVDTAAQLGYIYDDAQGAAAPALVSEMAPTPPTPAGPPELIAASDAPLVLAGGTAQVTVAMPSAAEGARMAAPARGDQRFFVSVDDIEAERDPGLAYAVYLDGPSGRRAHIGNVSFFGITTMNDPTRRHEGAPGFRQTFDATQALAELRAEGDLDPARLTVSFEPIVVAPPPGVVATEAFRAPEAVAPVRIGRVGLFAW